MSIRTSALVDDMSTQLVIRIAKPQIGRLSFDRRPVLNKGLEKIAKKLKKLTADFKTPTEFNEQTETVHLVDAMTLDLNTILRSVGHGARDAAELDRILVDPGPTDEEFDEIERELELRASRDVWQDKGKQALIDDISDLEELLGDTLFGQDAGPKPRKADPDESEDFPDLEK